MGISSSSASWYWSLPLRGFFPGTSSPGGFVWSTSIPASGGTGVSAREMFWDISGVKVQDSELRTQDSRMGSSAVPSLPKS